MLEVPNMDNKDKLENTDKPKNADKLEDLDDLDNGSVTIAIVQLAPAPVCWRGEVSSGRAKM
jgi:hypothetical protein